MLRMVICACAELDGAMGQVGGGLVCSGARQLAPDALSLGMSVLGRGGQTFSLAGQVLARAAGDVSQAVHTHALARRIMLQLQRCNLFIVRLARLWPLR